MAKANSSPEDAKFKEDLSQDRWAHDAASPSLITRMVAEAGGTFVLVLLGVGAAALAGTGGNGTLAVGLAFGVAAMGVIVVMGAVSGAHINPAVTVGAWVAGRFPGKDIAPYILAQTLGAALAGVVLYNVWATSSALPDARLVMTSTAISYGENSPAGFSLPATTIVEAIATGLLVAVILAATSVRAHRGQAPFAIGLALAILVMWTIPFTNAALNPARATASALFSEPWALQQLWVWWLAPIMGAAIVGLLFRMFGPEDDLAVTQAES